MTAQDQISTSRQSLGGGNYQELAPVITEAGRRCGWEYKYPFGISTQGKNYTAFGLTLDDLSLTDVAGLCGADLRLVSSDAAGLLAGLETVGAELALSDKE